MFQNFASGCPDFVEISWILQNLPRLCTISNMLHTFQDLAPMFQHAASVFQGFAHFFKILHTSQDFEPIFQDFASVFQDFAKFVKTCKICRDFAQFSKISLYILRRGSWRALSGRNPVNTPEYRGNTTEIINFAVYIEERNLARSLVKEPR